MGVFYLDSLPVIIGTLCYATLPTFYLALILTLTPFG